ncbi:MAG: GNAT family N-acetyltransferase [Hyphomonadaceae bacterium]
MIREPLPGDHGAIRAVVRHAFGRTEEADLAERLRADGDRLVELVAATEIALQGHILFSRLQIGEAVRAAALAPVSVLPAFQRQGIGAALITEGVRRCAALGLDAILVLGHPAYYPRFGFSAVAAENLAAPFSGPAFMALELKPGALASGGRVRYAAAFGVA